MNGNSFEVIQDGMSKLMKNVKISMSMTEWVAASTIIAGTVCSSIVAIQWIKSCEKIESKKLDFQHNRLNVEMA